MTTTESEIFLDTVREVIPYVRGASSVVVWSNMFVHDGAYIAVTKREILEVLSNELPGTPMRAKFVVATQQLMIN
jgi:hypothetical protein